MSRRLNIKFLVMTACLLSAMPEAAIAGNTWLDMNGIRVDNVTLNGASVDNLTYKADPPFVTTNVPPNVLIVLDNSGSMHDWAYSAPYDPTRYVPGDPVKKGYYGYFKPDKMYRYTGTEWVETTQTTGTIANPVASGDFLNWAMMRRIDVARKLLIGGKATPRSPKPGATVALYGEDSPTPLWDFAKTDSGGRMSPFPASSYRFEMRGDSLYVIPNYTPSDPAPRVPRSSANSTWLPNPSNSARHRTVDDKTINDNVDYIYITSNTTATQLFGYTAYTSGQISGIIQSVTVSLRARRSAKGTMRLRGAITVGGTTYLHTNEARLNDSWETYTFAWTSNPKRLDECAGNPDPACAAWRVEDLTDTSSPYYLNNFGVRNTTNASPSLYPMVTWIELSVSLTAPSGGPYKSKINWKGEDWAFAQGIISNLSNEARFGLAIFNRGDGLESGFTNGRHDGGRVENYIDFDTPVNMITSIHNMKLGSWTPLAETFFEMVRYFRQDPPFYTGNSPADYIVDRRYDPYYYQYTKVSGSNLPDQYVPCAKSFILMITDGEPTKDRNIPQTATGVPPGKNLRDYDNDGKDPGNYPNDGTDYLDDVALWARTVDARPDLPGDQNIYLYTVFAFGRNSQLLKDASINGGFEDLDGNGLPGPDPKEYLRDSNGDGKLDSSDMPLTYFEGDDGYELEASIINAITAILKRASSATSVSVLGASWKGQGALYQAYYYPIRSEGVRNVKWTGYFRSLFLDMNGLIHEDTDGDRALVLTKDRVVKMVSSGGNTYAELYWDKDGDGVLDPQAAVERISLDEIKPVWDGGKLLAARDPATRTIYTTIDSPNFKNMISFSTANASVLRPYIRGKTDADADRLIRFIRGEQIPGWRDRQLTVDPSTCGADSELCRCTNNLCTWKLGDIVFSDPVVVPAPMEAIDQIYGSPDYYAFAKRWANRRTMIYVGANDGMLHAFNGGYSFTDTSGAPIPPNQPQVRFAEKPDGTNDPAGTSGKIPLGHEMWAFIPYDLLPHLAWLADPDYQHVFYVDLTARVMDARIFTPDEDHVEGWGTILIVGLRFGGGEINVMDTFGGTTETRSFRSAYYALDITNPEKPPVLLWRFTDRDLGFTTSWPDIVRVDTDNEINNGNEKWFVVFGSGPSNYKGGRVISTNIEYSKFSGMTVTNPQLYILDLATGLPVGSNHSTSGRQGVIRFPETAGFTASPSSMDFKRADFSTDTIYLGTTFCSAGCDGYGSGTWSGNVYRVVTNKNTDPGRWSRSLLFNPGRAVTVSPSFARDRNDNVWIYFGTGRFIHIDERFQTGTYHYYGMKDPCWNGSCTTAVSSTALLDSTNIHVLIDGSFANAVTYEGRTFTHFSALEDYMNSTGKGWMKRLTGQGERVFVNGLIAAGVVAYGSFIPSTDVCSFEGFSIQYYPYYLTGTAYYKLGGHTVTYQVSGGTAISDRSSTIRGVPSAPAIHVSASGEVKLFIQSSTGAVITLPIETAITSQGGAFSWQEK